MMTHTELVARAARWLRSQGCGTVVAEKLPVSFEEPDAIGWKASGWSVLVECKASRADFRRDAKKPFRNCPVLGMGYRRYFMAPAGIIPVDEVPDGWGLIEVVGRRACVLLESKSFIERSHHHELCLLLAYVRRAEGVSKPLRKKVTTGPLLDLIA
jgi:hypothetical protein